ncbi:MAG: arsenite methyltransferase [Fusobacteriaceae bacterium]|jgi:ubiquinone/menaquinone biosynthesis C-methylase UbiE/DNA-binding transcriptional ArsR family regulator|nr:arsenite methyltransferase [Fusobacteriaceae bacterium]
MIQKFTEYAKIFKALSDEKRLRILHYISAGELCACELLEKFHITQPTLSHHMKILSNCRLVRGRPAGKWTYYSLGADIDKDVLHILTCMNETEGGEDEFTLKTNEELKQAVKEKYAKLALGKAEDCDSCCTSAASCGTDIMMNEDYSELEGYAEDADLGLGCGLPTKFAGIKAGDTVVDLGSGAGNDSFIARAETGESGRVIGIDFTPEMVAKARDNAKKLNYTNVAFIQGDIENIPLPDNTADVIVSNCVLNLVPDKKAVFAGIYRVLKPAGHFSISDIVTVGKMPEQLKSTAELYAGCVSGAMEREEYMQIIKQAGFRNIAIQKERAIEIPEAVLRENLSEAELKRYHKNPDIIRSVTVYAKK